jgi:hypothetical protein
MKGIHDAMADRGVEEEDNGQIEKNDYFESGDDGN